MKLLYFLLVFSSITLNVSSYSIPSIYVSSDDEYKEQDDIKGGDYSKKLNVFISTDYISFDVSNIFC